MAGIPAARVGSGGIYSLAIMASANETSVLYRRGKGRTRRCCGIAAVAAKMSASVAVRGEHVFSMIHTVAEFVALSKFNLAFCCNNCNHTNDRKTAEIISYIGNRFYLKFKRKRYYLISKLTSKIFILYKKNFKSTSLFYSFKT